MEQVVTETKDNTRQIKNTAQPKELSQLGVEAFDRFPVPISEFNRVLGGGIVPGSLILIGGEPGIGKSTLLLQASAMVAKIQGKVVYVSGEETPNQIKIRARTVGYQWRRSLPARGDRYRYAFGTRRGITTIFAYH